MNAWIGVDLDGTIAQYTGWQGERHIGDPIPAMVDRVKKWLAEGLEVRIFTARVAGPRQGISPEETTWLIQDWCAKHIGVPLPVTCVKDFGMTELWDDRAKQVMKNSGISLDDLVAELGKHNFALREGVSKLIEDIANYAPTVILDTLKALLA